MSGRAIFPAGTGDNLQRPVVIGTTEDNRRNLVWRMGQYERRKRGSAL